MSATEERFYRALSWLFIAGAAYLFLRGHSGAAGYCGVALAIHALIRAGRLEREVKELRASRDQTRT